MSNKLPGYSQTESNNSGQYVSRAFQRVQFLGSPIYHYLVDTTESSSDSDSMAAPSVPGDNNITGVFSDDLETLSATEVGDHAPSSPSSGTEVSGGATIEVITVEKYKRSDGFANPYHIQGLNASTPDDVDDDDEDEDEDGEHDIDITDAANQDLDETVDVNMHECDEGDEITLTKEVIDENDIVDLNKIPIKDFKNKHPSIPTSSESTVSSESPCLSNTSSNVPVPHSVTVPRSDSVSSAGQPQRLFQFTVERVPSTDSNCDQLPAADHQQTTRITPPVSSVSRAPTSDSLFIPEVPSDSVSVDESITAESAAPATTDIIPAGGNAPWLPAEYQSTGADLPYQVPQWEPCEIAAAAAATAAVASAVVNPGVPAAQTNQTVVLGHTSQPHYTQIAVAAASAAVAAMNNMMVDSPNIQPANVPQPEISGFPKPSIMGSEMHATTSFGHADMLAIQSSYMPTRTISTFDRDSTPSPGAPTQSYQDRSHPVGTENPQEKRENEEGEIRFRRARYLEKRERWHDKRFLVVDTFRREEPVSRPEAKLPDFNYPVNCRRCREGLQPIQTKHRPCPCSTQTAPTLQQWMEKYRFPDHNNDNHGYNPAKNKHRVENYFGYPETIAFMEHTRHMMYRSNYSASSINPHNPTDVVIAAATAAMSKANSTRETSVSCPVQPTNTIPTVTLRRKGGLQRNNSSHFQIAKSSPSSFNANEIHVDKVAAMAVAAVVSVKAAMERGERGLQSERSSETEVDHPMNPPTSPANGHNRDSLNRSSSMSEMMSLNKMMTLPAVDRTFSMNYGVTNDRCSSGNEESLSARVAPTPGAMTASVVNQSNAHLVGAPPSRVHPVHQAFNPSSGVAVDDGTKTRTETFSVMPSREDREETIHPAAVGSQKIGIQSLPQSGIHSTFSHTNQRHPSNEEPSQVQSMHQHPPNPTVPQSTSAPQLPPDSSHSHPAGHHESVQLPLSQSRQSHQPPQSQLPANQNLPTGASPGHMVSTGSMGATEPYPVSQSSATGTINPPEANVGATYSNCGLVMQGFGVSGMVPGDHGLPRTTNVNTHLREHPAVSARSNCENRQSLPNIHESISSNLHIRTSMTQHHNVAASNRAIMHEITACVQQSLWCLKQMKEHNTSMNYLDQYHRMQHLIPVGPTAPGSTAQESVRQNTEARIAQSLDNVRLTMLSYFRELEDKHTYQIKSLQEEVRQLREQRERDHAIIREYVPPECLLQLGHPYASLANVAPQPTRPGAQNASINTAPMPSSGQPVQPLGQAVAESIPNNAAQPHLPSVNSTQSSQPPPSQQPE